MGQFQARFIYPSYHKRKNVTLNTKIFHHGAVWGTSLKTICTLYYKSVQIVFNVHNPVMLKILSVISYN